jgi:hypothetical protein
MVTAMARKTEQPEPLVLSPREWAPLQEAYTRAKAATGSRDLAERDLHVHMCSERLPSATRYLDGTAKRLNKEYWDAHSLVGEWTPLSDIQARENPVDASDAAPRFVSGYFFVRRKELDNLYPVSGSDISTSGDEPLPPIGGQRGPKSEQDWKKHAGRELARRASAGESVPTASAMCQWCVDQLDHHPDIGDMSDLIRVLRVLFDG